MIFQGFFSFFYFFSFFFRVFQGFSHVFLLFPGSYQQFGVKKTSEALMAPSTLPSRAPSPSNTKAPGGGGRAE